MRKAQVGEPRQKGLHVMPGGFYFLTGRIAAGSLVSKIFDVHSGSMNSSFSRFLKILVQFLLTLILLEGGLRLTGIMKTHAEKQFGTYISVYHHYNNSWFHRYEPFDTINFHETEFHYSSVTNSAGLREREIPLQKDSNEFRIITLGDSFTEGAGAPYDSTFPYLLQNLLNSRSADFRYEVYNAGISGSDLLFEDKLLRFRLRKFNPDAVIFMLNISDVEDLIQRGGSERFMSDTTCVFPKPPRVESIYRYSHVARCLIRLIGMNHNMLLPRKLRHETKLAIQELNTEIDSIYRYCEANSIQCNIFWHPYPVLIRQSDYDDIRKFREGTPLYKLFPFHKGIHLADNKRIINLYAELTESLYMLPYEQYAWPIDGHFNSYGYSVLAEVVSDCLNDKLCVYK